MNVFKYKYDQLANQFKIVNKPKIDLSSDSNKKIKAVLQDLLMAGDLNLLNQLQELPAVQENKESPQEVKNFNQYSVKLEELKKSSKKPVSVWLIILGVLFSAAALVFSLINGKPIFLILLFLTLLMFFIGIVCLNEYRKEMNILKELEQNWAGKWSEGSKLSQEVLSQSSNISGSKENSKNNRLRRRFFKQFSLYNAYLKDSNELKEEPQAFSLRLFTNQMSPEINFVQNSSQVILDDASPSKKMKKLNLPSTTILSPTNVQISKKLIVEEVVYIEFWEVHTSNPNTPDGNSKMKLFKTENKKSARSLYINQVKIPSPLKQTSRQDTNPTILENGDLRIQNLDYRTKNKKLEVAREENDIYYPPQRKLLTHSEVKRKQKDQLLTEQVEPISIPFKRKSSSKFNSDAVEVEIKSDIDQEDNEIAKDYEIASISSISNYNKVIKSKIYRSNLSDDGILKQQLKMMSGRKKKFSVYQGNSKL